MSLAVGCTPRGPKNPQEAAGEYVFRYKTGEIEVVILNTNRTFRQEFYKLLDSYQQNNIPVYTNSGTWSYDRSALTFNQWLRFCDYPNPNKLLDSPELLLGCTTHWEPAVADSDAAIWFSEPFNYVFMRVKSRNEVK